MDTSPFRPARPASGRSMRRHSRAVGAAVLAILFACGTAQGKDEKKGVGDKSASQSATFYSLDMEDAQVQNGKLVPKKGKPIELKGEGGGRPPEVVYDDLAKSHVLVVKTDPTPSGKIKDREELQVYSGVKLNQTWALGMSVFIPTEVKFTDNWHLLAQCHQSGGGVALSPPFSLNLIAPDKIAVVARSDEDPFKALTTQPMPRGRWVRLETEFRIGDPGHVTFWMDGQKVLDQDATLRFKSGYDACSLKVGTYRGKATTPHEIRFDDIRFGASRAAVSLH